MATNLRAPALARLSARLYNAPLLVLPDVAETIAANLGARFAGLAEAPLAMFEPDDPNGADDFDGDEPYVVSNGVATIPVRGELINRGSWLASASGLTSYESLQSALRMAAADPRVESVVLDIDSPGGEAAGAMETAEEVRALSRIKPVTAFVNSMAASAAYAIAAGAKEIVATPSATLGSIGVVWMHMDKSEALAAMGVKPTLLHAGAYKVDGNSMAPLADGPKARIQAQIDDIYALFADTVGKMRPKLGAAGARKTEAGVFMGRKAVEAGLADRIGMFPGMGARRAANPLRMSNPVKDTSMTTEQIASLAPAPPAAAEEPPLAGQEATMADAMAISAARSDGAASERARILSILDSDAAKGKATLARHFALATDMSLEAATAALTAAGTEAVLTGQRMAAVPTLNIRPEPPQRERDPAAEADSAWASLAADLSKSAGAKAR